MTTFASHCSRDARFRCAAFSAARKPAKAKTAICHPRCHEAAALPRREALVDISALAAAFVLGASDRASAAVSAEITHKVFFDIGICSEQLNRDRRMGDKSALCAEPEAAGRVVLGLYGRLAPQTVSNFVELVQDGVYTGTTFHKVLPGRYIQAGRQGSKRYGRVDSGALSGIPEKNSDVVSSAAFSLSHSRPGTLSLCIGENDDDAAIKGVPGYRNVQILITTGPGPVPQLDGENLVFGQVLDGFETLNYIAGVPTIKPNQQLEQMNAFASLLGDERAAKARQQWGAPLKAVIITQAGVMAA